MGWGGGEIKIDLKTKKELGTNFQKLGGGRKKRRKKHELQKANNEKEGKLKFQEGIERVGGRSVLEEGEGSPEKRRDENREVDDKWRS